MKLHLNTSKYIFLGNKNISSTYKCWHILYCLLSFRFKMMDYFLFPTFTNISPFAHKLQLPEKVCLHGFFMPPLSHLSIKNLQWPNLPRVWKLKKHSVLSFQLDFKVTKDNLWKEENSHWRFKHFFLTFYSLQKKKNLPLQMQFRSRRWRQRRWMVPAVLIIRSRLQESEECGWALAVSRLAL